MHLNFSSRNSQTSPYGPTSESPSPFPSCFVTSQGSVPAGPYGNQPLKGSLSALWSNVLALLEAYQQPPQDG